MENRRRIIIATMLMLAIGNFSRLTNNSIRPIQFISVFVIGALTALLINEFVTLFKAKRK